MNIGCFGKEIILKIGPLPETQNYKDCLAEKGDISTAYKFPIFFFFEISLKPTDFVGGRLYFHFYCCMQASIFLRSG